MKILDKLFCSHRHDINAHPSCFAVGNVNDAHAESMYEKYGKPWYQVDGWKIGYLDIESDGLKVDFSTMLSWCIKTKDGNVIYDVITKEELFDGTTDQRIVKSLTETLKQYKIIITYYGTNFDVPYVRAKAMHYGFDFPAYINEEYETKSGIKVRTTPELCHFDLYYLVKAKLTALSSKSLANVCDYLDIEGKTPLKKETWRRAKYGDPEALKEVLEHNVGDVEILEVLHNRLEPYSKWTKRGV